MGSSIGQDRMSPHRTARIQLIFFDMMPVGPTLEIETDRAYFFNYFKSWIYHLSFVRTRVLDLDQFISECKVEFSGVRTVILSDLHFRCEIHL